MRILVIEDNRHVARALQMGLRTQYAVDTAFSGSEGLMHAESTAYDVILLDLNLPDISGEEICTELRKNGNKTPILVLTGRDTLQDKVNLLDMGADDYLTKPFRLEEVQARIRVALRHGNEQPNGELRVGDITLDPAARTVRRGDQPIVLRRKEFDLLEYMMRNPGRSLTRAMILEHIWDMNENLWANVVDVHIKHLRDKIDRPFGSHLIKTVHGVGYKLEAARRQKVVANT